MVSHLRAPILKSFYYPLWFYFVTVSEFSCLAKSFPVSGLTPMSQIPNQLHFIQKSAHEVLGATLEACSCQFSHKISCFVYKTI